MITINCNMDIQEKKGVSSVLSLKEFMKEYGEICGEYLLDNPLDGSKSNWEYYSDPSEAAQRAKAVKRWTDKNYPGKSLDDVYDIVQAKINKGENLPEDVHDYVYSYNEPKSAKEFLNRAIGLYPIVIGAGTTSALLTDN